MSELLNPVIQKALQKHDSNLVWYQNNYHNLKQGHLEEFILIIDEGKVEYYRDISKLRERMKDKDLNTQSIVIEYISEHNIPMIV
jgi:hypothetical protein